MASNRSNAAAVLPKTLGEAEELPKSFNAVKKFPVDLMQLTSCQGGLIQLKTLDTVEGLLNRSKTADEPSKRLDETEKAKEGRYV